MPLHDEPFFSILLRLASVEMAADLLREGGVVAIPTDTVYGSAASLAHPEALDRIFTIKNRDPVQTAADSGLLHRRRWNTWSTISIRILDCCWTNTGRVRLPLSWLRACTAAAGAGCGRDGRRSAAESPAGDRADRAGGRNDRLHQCQYQWRRNLRPRPMMCSPNLGPRSTASWTVASSPGGVSSTVMRIRR